MKKFESIKLTSDFSQIYKRGRYAHKNGLVLYYKRDHYSLLGVVASKKIGNAVLRNKAKRILRALFRSSSVDLFNGSYVLVAKASIFDLSYITLQKDLTAALKRVGAI